MRAALLIVLLSLAACGDDEGDLTLPDGGGADAGPEGCDPLMTGDARPIALGELLAAGRDADGIVYVLDQLDGEVRAYVSDGDTLQRHRVLGSGSGSLPGVEFWDVEVEADPPFGLYLEVPEDGEPTFTKVSPGDRDVPDASAEGEALALLTSSEVARFTLANLPPEVTIEYLGELEDGRFVLVTRPEDDFGYEDFRVFLGRDTLVLEREVGSVLRQRDGGSTTIELTVDGEPATLRFPITNVNGQFEPGPWTFEQGGEVQAVERIEPSPGALDGLSFFCR